MTDIQSVFHKVLAQEYEGETDPETGAFHGQGKLWMNNGHVYDGTFHQGWLHGKGILYWNDGTIYEGDFQENRATGSCRIEWPDQGCHYSGDVCNFQMNGNGTLTHNSTGKECTGQWKNGQLEGKGKIDYKHGNNYDGKLIDGYLLDRIQYLYGTGEWKNGLRHGQGRMEYASGNVYEGQWENNLRNGQGFMNWKTRGESYTGTWVDGLPNGYGEYQWNTIVDLPHRFPTKNIYTGNWVNGSRHGSGTFCYATGAIYSGEWKNNMKHGHGFYRDEYGHEIEGEWEKDRFVSFKIQKDPSVVYKFGLQSLTHSKDALVDVNDVLKRYKDIFRNTFDKLVRSSPRKSRSLTLVSVWQFFDQIGLRQRNLNYAMVNRSVASVYKNHRLFGARFHNPHEPTQKILYYDFLEYLIHAAVHTFGLVQPDLQLCDRGVAAALTRLVEMNLKQPSLDTLTVTDEVIVNSNVLFTFIAKKNLACHKNSQCDVSLLVREMLMKFHYANVLRDAKLSMNQFLKLLAETLPQIRRTDEDKKEYFNLDVEICKYDFDLVLKKLEPSIGSSQLVIDKISRSLGLKSSSRPKTVIQKSEC